MQYCTKKKLPYSDLKEDDDNKKNSSESWVTLVLIITALVFTIMMILQVSIIFEDIYFEDLSVTTINNKIPSHLNKSLFSHVLKRDDLNELIFVSFDKDRNTLNSRVCVSVDYNHRFTNCTGIMSVKEGYHVSLPPKAEILGNKKVVLATVWKKILTSENEKPNGAVEFYVVDLNDKDKKPIVFRGPYDNETLRTYKPFEIIPYYRKFDVFIKSTEFCDPPGSICTIRYNDEGKWLGTFDFHFETRNNAFNLERFHPLKKFNDTAGYAYISMQNSTVKLLNQFLEVTKEKIIIGQITSYSVADGNIGICSIVNRLNPYTTCVKVDSQLEVKKEFLLKNEPGDFDWRLFNLVNGDALAIAISKTFPLSAKVKRLSSDGKISKSESFVLENCKSHLDPFDQFDELSGNYCFSFTCFRKSVTYCLDSSKAFNLTSYQIEY